LAIGVVAVLGRHCRAAELQLSIIHWTVVFVRRFHFAERPLRSDAMIILDGVLARLQSRQFGVSTAVIGVHLLLLLAWPTSVPDMRPRQEGGNAVSVTVWLKELPSLPAERAESNRLHDVPSAGRPVRRGRNMPAQSLAVSTQQTAIGGGQVSASLSTAQTDSSAQDKQTGAALNLDLSPGALKLLAAPSLAGRTPYQGKLPATIERQIAAAAAETGSWTEERIDIDHIRLRRGNTCVILSRPASARIDPFNESMRRMPWTAAYSKC
jgi:hypothetical protein